MYGMSGAELLTQLKVRDTLREAERIHQVCAVLKERNAVRRTLFAPNISRRVGGLAVADFFLGLLVGT